MPSKKPEIPVLGIGSLNQDCGNCFKRLNSFEMSETAVLLPEQSNIFLGQRRLSVVFVVDSVLLTSPAIVTDL